MIPLRVQPLLALIALLCISSFNPSLAQQNDSLVIRVSVTGENAKPFAGLTAENFSVTVDKTPRKIISFRAESVPSSIGILLDASDSSGVAWTKPSREFRRRIVDGITRFSQVSNPANNYFAAVFDGKVSFTEGWLDAGNTLALTNSGDARGTALYDSIYYALERLATAPHSRRVIVLISDGHDNISKRTFKEVRDAIKNSDVTVYAICVTSNAEQGSALGVEGLGVLDELTGVSGGRTFPLKTDAKPEIVKGTFDLIARDINGQYQLTIQKDAAATPKKWRKLRIKLNKDGAKGWPKLYVRTRDGYYQ